MIFMNIFHSSKFELRISSFYENSNLKNAIRLHIS